MPSSINAQAFLNLLPTRYIARFAQNASAHL